MLVLLLNRYADDAVALATDRVILLASLCLFLLDQELIAYCNMNEHDFICTI